MRAGGWRRSRRPASWARASASPCATWRSAARASCWARGSTATSPRSASISTRGCWRRRCRRRGSRRRRTTGRLTGRRRRQGPSTGVGRRNLLEDPLAPTVHARPQPAGAHPGELRAGGGAAAAALPPPGRADRHVEAVDEMAQELADRFGPVPEEVENLLYVVQVKVLAVNAGVEAIGQEEGQLLIKCARWRRWIASRCRTG